MSLADFRSRISALFRGRQQRDKRFLEILLSDDDMIAVVLRGHLVVEELLFSAIAAHCQEPEKLRSAWFTRFKRGPTHGAVVSAGRNGSGRRIPGCA